MDLRFVLGLFLALFVIASVESKYSDEVKSFFSRMDSEGWRFNGGLCTATAKSKMRRYFYKSSDKQYAIGIINIYSQQCGRGGLTFYSELNRQLRTQHPAAFWATAANLLNRAIDVLGQKSYPKLYRGCAHSDPSSYRRGDTFHFNQFVSTSKSASTALSFAGCGTLYIFENISGTDISSYSAYAGEKEVLLKSTLALKLKQDPLTDSTSVANLKHSLGLTGTITKAVYLVLPGSSLIG